MVIARTQGRRQRRGRTADVARHFTERSAGGRMGLCSQNTIGMAMGSAECGSYPAPKWLISPQYAVPIQSGTMTQPLHWLGKTVPTTYGRPILSAFGSSTWTSTEW